MYAWAVWFNSVYCVDVYFKVNGIVSNIIFVKSIVTISLCVPPEDFKLNIICPLLTKLLTNKLLPICLIVEDVDVELSYGIILLLYWFVPVHILLESKTPWIGIEST